MSSNSPATGADRKKGRDDRKTAERGAASGAGTPKLGTQPTPAAGAEPATAGLEIHFEHARWRHFGWMAFGALAGLVLITQLGTVGQGLGVILALLGAFNAYGFVRTLIKPAGRIVVDDSSVCLSEGLCHGSETWVERQDVRHTYLLRRAAPWLRSGPMLVIETADRAFVYPRDWFGSEADQRRIAEALQQGVAAPPAKRAKAKASRESAKVAKDAKAAADRAGHASGASGDDAEERESSPS